MATVGGVTLAPYQPAGTDARQFRPRVGSEQNAAGPRGTLGQVSVPGGRHTPSASARLASAAQARRAPVSHHQPIQAGSRDIAQLGQPFGGWLHGAMNVPATA